MSRPGATGPRTAAVAVGLLVLVLVAVLVGLLGPGTDTAAPTATGASSAPSSTASARRSVASSPAATSGSRDPETGLRTVALADLPRQAQDTVALIDAGGPFPYAKDGVTFGNNERLLPAHPRGWYHEYTVPTPGENDRGARRIVTGDEDRLVFYSADHYRSFVRVVG